MSDLVDLSINNVFVPYLDNDGNEVMSVNNKVIQDEILLSLITPIGSLFYDVSFGSKLVDFVNSNKTVDTYDAFCNEIESVVNTHREVEPGSADCRFVFEREGRLLFECIFFLLDRISLNIKLSTDFNFDNLE